MELLEKVANILARILENFRGIRDMHLEDRVGSEVFGKFGTASIAPGTSVDVLSILNPRGFGMSTHDLGICAEPALWGASGAGITYTIKRNDSAFPHLAALDFPWGSIIARSRLKLAFRTGEALVVTATNNHATETIDVCVAVTGMYYSAVRGVVSDKESRAA